MADGARRPGRPRTDPFWVEWVRSKVVNDPKLTLRRLSAMAGAEAKRQKRGDAPSETTIKRIRADILKADDEVQRDYRHVYWPESFERGDLPAESQAAFLELMGHYPRLTEDHEGGPEILIPTTRQTVEMWVEEALLVCEGLEVYDARKPGDERAESVRKAMHRLVEEIQKWLERYPAAEAGRQPMSRPSLSFFRDYWRVRQAMPLAPVDVVYGVCMHWTDFGLLSPESKNRHASDFTTACNRHLEYAAATRPDGGGAEWAEILEHTGMLTACFALSESRKIEQAQDLRSFQEREREAQLFPDYVAWLVQRDQGKLPTWLATALESARLTRLEAQVEPVLHADDEWWMREVVPILRNTELPSAVSEKEDVRDG